jgi:hypothetical protein
MLPLSTKHIPAIQNLSLMPAMKQAKFHKL